MRVYLVEDEESYVYGVFSTWFNARRWIRKELKKDFSRPNHTHMLEMLKNPNYFHLYEIYPMEIDNRLNES